MSLLDRFRQQRPPPAELDLLLVSRLRSIGEDLTRPRVVVHFLDLPGEREALAARAALEEAGYEATLAAPEAPDAPWSLRAEARRVVDETTVPGFRAWFERLAAEHGGAYDGWEAPTSR
jgi:hypothetical protein